MITKLDDMLIKNLYQYIKYKRILDKICKEERVLVNLSRLFKTQFKRDWIGRIYAVVNPRTEGPDDPVAGASTQIYEFMPDGTLSENMWIEKWVMDKMNIAAAFFKNNNLFELADYSLDKIDEWDNWLFVIQPIPWRDLKKSMKRFAIFLGILVAAGIAALIII